MTDPIQHFYHAALAAAQRTGHETHPEALLLRFGFPTLGLRFGGNAPAELRPVVVPLHRLGQAVLYEHAREVAQALDRGGVPHFFAKGITLLGSTWRFGERLVADMDLYIRDRDLWDALRLLEGLRYRERPTAQQAGPRSLRSAISLQRHGSMPVERTIIDLHTALDPVERILPRRDHPLPPRFWDRLQQADGLTVPAPEDHAVILMHHLVHTDLLHLRSLVDLALVLRTVPADGMARLREHTAMLRIRRMAYLFCRLIGRDFGIGPAPADPPPGRPLAPWLAELSLDSWLDLVAHESPSADDAVTFSRLRRRLQMVDGGAWRTLAADAVLPPEAFLRWRWQTDRVWQARGAHYLQLFRKTVASL